MHGEGRWREFCLGRKLAGYDNVRSIEHEEGMRRSVNLLRTATV
jgi:hypothetical protein